MKSPILLTLVLLMHSKYLEMAKVYDVTLYDVLHLEILGGLVLLPCETTGISSNGDSECGEFRVKEPGNLL